MIEGRSLQFVEMMRTEVENGRAGGSRLLSPALNPIGYSIADLNHRAVSPVNQSATGAKMIMSNSAEIIFQHSSQFFAGGGPEF